jgi:Replication protein
MDCGVTWTPPHPLPGGSQRGEPLYSEATPQAFPPSSFLEPLESSPPSTPAHISHQRFGSRDWYDSPGIDPLESHFRHNGWCGRRHKVYASLMRTGQSEARKDSFANCGQQLHVHLKADHSEIRLTASHCHDRFCVPCQTARSRLIAAAVEGLIRDHDTRFVTLTLRASNTPLTDQVDRLYRSFSVLRRRTWWRENVVGGAAFCEVKVGKNSGLWHPHLHILVEGSYLNQKQLSREWYAVTGDSFIVDVRECSDPEGRARYVTKYVTKPASTEVFQATERLDEFLVAMKGRRLCFTFGTWRGVKLDPHEPVDGEWQSLGRLETVVNRALDGDAASQRWCEALLRRYPTLDQLGRFFPRPP